MCDDENVGDGYAYDLPSVVDAPSSTALGTGTRIAEHPEICVRVGTQRIWRLLEGRGDACSGG